MKELAAEIVEMAMKDGASAAEVQLRKGSDFIACVRLGRVDRLLRADFRKLGIRIFAGNRSAISATSDFSLQTLHRMVKDTLDMARAAGEDPSCGLPPAAAYSREVPRLELCFEEAWKLPVDAKIGLARKCEDAALRFDPRINNSEGSEFSDSVTHTAYANSHGVLSEYSRSAVSLSATPLAEIEGRKQRDYWLSRHCDFRQLEPAEEVGAEAARRVLRRLGARKISTCRVPVVFDPLAAAALLKHVAEAVAGTALVRKASFLVDRLGSRVASANVTIFDDALLPGGLGSRPFDAEGVPSQTTPVIRGGKLENYLLDAYSARKLGLRTTANSNRELHGAPSVGPSNFYLKSGPVSPREIVASVKRGLYVTELIGFGVNIVSGDYSQGAAGLWIEGGETVFPVEEITIAGNLKDMLTSVEAVGNDPLILEEIFAPTMLIGRMVVGGN